MTTLQAIEALARDARAGDDEDWGSADQIEAQNAFFAAVEAMMHRVAWEEFSAWCLKATTDEMIDEALRLLREE